MSRPAPAPRDSPALAEARRVLEAEANAIRGVAERLGPAFDRAIDLLALCRGRVVTTGMGKSGIIARKLAATFSSTGTPALYLHPAEAVHGDIGSVVEGDVLIALSQTGETAEIARLIEILKRLAIPLIALTGRPDSTLGRRADVVLDVGVDREACPLGLAPTASTTAALAMGDALAMSLLSRKGFSADDFAAVHPGGGLGTKLRRVADLMHPASAIPTVRPHDTLDRVIASMTSGRLGLTVVVDESGRLAGLITDGDLRRLLEGRLRTQGGADLLELPASACMTASPRTIDPEALAGEALRLMEAHRITALVVVDPGQSVLGVIHLHDLWRMELI
jgi:arabinose-5-phosphate isomerase